MGSSNHWKQPNLNGATGNWDPGVFQPLPRKSGLSKELQKGDQTQLHDGIAQTSVNDG